MDAQMKKELEQGLGKESNAELKARAYLAGIDFISVMEKSVSPRYALITALIDAIEKKEGKSQ